MAEPAKLVLASGSPRRRQLLEQQGFTFRIEPPDVDESPLGTETPLELVERLAISKAGAIDSSAVTLAADTVVSIDGDILGKPRDADDAKSMLRRLSGRSHLVTSGVAVRAATTTSFVVITEVQFVELTATMIDRYVATGEPMDKAGAYGIQGIGGALVRTVNGSYTNVVGLPLAETVDALALAGVHPVGAPTTP